MRYNFPGNSAGPEKDCRILFLCFFFLYWLLLIKVKKTDLTFFLQSSHSKVLKANSSCSLMPVRLLIFCTTSEVSDFCTLFTSSVKEPNNPVFSFFPQRAVVKRILFMISSLQCGIVREKQNHLKCF